MFGYLQIQKSELLVREAEAYKAVYCGLCKQMGRDYSFLTRFSLSYDCTFYAMLLMSLKRSCSGFADGRCTFNPIKKCKFARDKGAAYTKAAAFSVISAYYKIIDDINDDGFWKRILKRGIKPFFSHWRRKAAKSFPELDNCVSEMMRLQAEAERNSKRERAALIDASAHPTALMLAEVMSLDGKDETERRVLREFGYHLGRWIYLIDAADDVDDDIKRGGFNPFAEYVNEDRTSAADYITSVLNNSLARAYDAYCLLDIVDFKGIMDNMLTLGFPAVQNKITDKLLNEKLKM